MDPRRAGQPLARDVSTLDASAATHRNSYGVLYLVDGEAGTAHRWLPTTGRWYLMRSDEVARAGMRPIPLDLAVPFVEVPGRVEALAREMYVAVTGGSPEYCPWEYVRADIAEHYRRTIRQMPSLASLWGMRR